MKGDIYELGNDSAERDLSHSRCSTANLDVCSADDDNEKTLTEIAILAFNNILGVNLNENIELEIVLDHLTVCTPEGPRHRKHLPNLKRSGLSLI